MSFKKQVKKTTLKQFNLEVHSATIGRLVKNKDDIGNNPSKKDKEQFKFDLKMANRKVILLVDNAKCHSSSNLNLYNTTVYYLPLNMTSHIQLLDAGIIMSFKRCYKNYFIKWLLDQYESGTDKKLNVLNGMKFIVQAWKEVSPETVLNCFWHTGILPVVQNEEPTNNNNDNELMEEMKEDIEALNFQNAMSLEVYINYPEEENTNEILNDQEILNLVTNIELEKDLNNGNSEDEDDSKKIPLITYHEALNAVEVLEQYFMQQDLSDKVWLDHDQALLNLQRTIRKV
ncbi:12494_t:CDS:2 [Gigaspora margarita]|uniref:12494_t:CDS:1 n=1 Tax=Gigaspora margarita TaxID=4874 RepID=A0ABN7W3H2_GIGMA|nr:12494_t:CDS:2 [Gigaspora margarita]